MLSGNRGLSRNQPRVNKTLQGEVVWDKRKGGVPMGINGKVKKSQLVEQIRENIYLIPVPLPRNPLKVLNTYLIRGKRDLLIDTGFNLDSCEQTLLSAFAQLGVKKENLDVGITHFHSDHVGLLHRLTGPENIVWCGKIPWDFLGVEDQRWKQRIERLRRFGLDLGPEYLSKEWDPQKQPEFDLEWLKARNFKEISDGQILPLGDLNLRCIETSGHFPGHICFYEPKQKFLFSGDHILDTISPNVTCYNLENPSSLGQYLKNLDRIKELEIDLVLPGHRNIFQDCNRRIEELKAHHEKRLTEVKRIVGGGEKTGVEIAARMSWNLSYSSWDEFPPTQKFFALGEALAHLNYLIEKGVVGVKEKRGGYYFFIQQI